MNKKISWFRQKDKSSCGPVALLNVLKWVYPELQFSYRRNKAALKKLAHFEIERGCWPWNIGAALDTMAHQYNRINIVGANYYGTATLKDLDRWIDAGNIVLFCYYWGKNKVGHYALIIGRTDKSYICVNDSNQRVISYNLRSVMKSKLKVKSWHPGAYICSCCWAIGRKQNG